MMKQNMYTATSNKNSHKNHKESGEDPYGWYNSEVVVVLGVFVVDITETAVVDEEGVDGVVEVEDVSTFVVEENDVVDEVVDIEEVVDVEVEVEVEVEEVVDVVVVDDMVDSAVLTMVSGM